ncbi:Hypothetical predicted protein [Olea europaea subsp. europaea]|uniref:CBF1-interacting co-repressor CIR N-terminal domain-containing protein n=1 Tax=Olea europaea subsp. europaea TaxID=158383 RepID=A0A8S0SXH2_OLEEU|nr:Hypothetical predicted protein [Olea europaea subsp. europaea]
MGGHGGLNILPQKRWNVYNYKNREQVKQDEEAAAKEEQLMREQARERDTESRLEKLRQARCLSSAAHASKPSTATQTVSSAEPPKSDSDSKHINLFEGIKIFDPIKIDRKEDEKKGKFSGYNANKKMKKEESVPVVEPEDENGNVDEKNGDEKLKVNEKSGGKKTVEELREERLKRERKEKERERALIVEKSRKDGGFS